MGKLVPHSVFNTHMPEQTKVPSMLEEALAAYCRTAARAAAGYQQPAPSLSEQEGRVVTLHNINGPLASYRIGRVGTGWRLRRID